MYVKQIYAGWVGIVVERKVTSGVFVADATAACRAQLAPYQPTEREVKRLSHDLAKLSTTGVDVTAFQRFIHSTTI